MPLAGRVGEVNRFIYLLIESNAITSTIRYVMILREPHRRRKVGIIAAFKFAWYEILARRANARKLYYHNKSMAYNKIASEAAKDVY